MASSRRRMYLRIGYDGSGREAGDGMMVMSHGLLTDV